MRSIPVHQLSPNVNPLDTTKRQVKNSTGQLRDCCLRSSYDFPESPGHCSPTKYARVSRCSHWDVVMLFCPSLTQSERFLQTGQLITRLQVVVVTNFIRMLMRNVFVNVFQVRCSDSVGSDLPHPGSPEGAGGDPEEPSPTNPPVPKGRCQDPACALLLLLSVFARDVFSDW